MPTVTEILETMEYGPAPEASGEVTAWLKARGQFGHFIDGAFTKPGKGLARDAEGRGCGSEGRARRPSGLVETGRP